MYSYVKRLLDVVLAILLLILLAVPMCVVALFIKLEDGRTCFL
ncbi:MAG: sugar transferase [Clostridia bacterium]|nr:sugar transferase [Clostridia bacterium]